jgi:hypothetical protein
VLYLDGVLQGVTQHAQIAYANNYFYQLGMAFTASWPAGNGEWLGFNGILDEAAFYNRALTPAEVATIYASGSAGRLCGTAGSVRFRGIYAATRSLVVSGPGGPPNSSFLVLGTTNIAIPLSNWTILATNYFDSLGNFSFTNTVNQAVPQQFLRLQLP